MAQKVLIAGASGFFGAAICEAFVAAGWQVFGTSRSGQFPDRLKRAGLEGKVQMLSLSAEEPVEAIADRIRDLDCNVVVNSIAYGVNADERDEMEAIAVNITGTAKLLHAAETAGIARFIQIGTCAEYGNRDQVCHETTFLQPGGLYGTTKAASSLYVLGSGTSSTQKCVIRPFPMYGPYEQKNKFIPAIARACHLNEVVHLTEGEQIRDYLFVQDGAQAIVAVASMTDFPDREIFNLGSGIETSLRELGETIREAAAGSPDLLQWGARPYRDLENMKLVPSIEKILSRTDWKPGTSLQQGIAKTLQLPWFL
jgi:nucleoside-diphosphate-sugar epimerase